jgi:hypothetical protein
MTKTDEKWAERIRQWQESGKTAEDFTRGQPYKASTLKWRAADLRRQAEGSTRYGKGRASAEPIRMARVVVRGGDKVAKPSAGLLVVEVSGARISLSRGFDAELFADVVRVLATGVAR